MSSCKRLGVNSMETQPYGAESHSGIRTTEWFTLRLVQLSFFRNTISFQTCKYESFLNLCLPQQTACLWGHGFWSDNRYQTLSTGITTNTEHDNVKPWNKSRAELRALMHPVKAAIGRTKDKSDQRKPQRHSDKPNSRLNSFAWSCGNIPMFEPEKAPLTPDGW